MARRGRRGRRSTQRSRNRARARARAKASAKKRVSARKAAGRKPSGANKAANRAAARARAQAAAKKRIAQGRTISQTKAANKKKMQAAAAERNRKFQAEKAAAAKRRQEAAAKKRAEAAARKKADAAAKRRQEAAAAKKQSPAKTFNDAKTTIQNRNLIAEAPRKINPFNIFQTQEALKEGAAAREGKRDTVTDKPGLLDRILNRNTETQKSIDQASARTGTQLAFAGNMANLGIRNNDKTFFKVKDPASYGVKTPDTLGRDVSFGPVRDGDTYAKNITNFGMKYGRTPEARGKAYEQTLNPKSFKGLSDGQTFGVGPVASGDAYARGLNTDNKNLENRLRQVRNLGSTLTGGLIPSVRKLTDKEIADRRIKNAEFRRNNLMGRRTGGSGGGVSRIQQQAAATQMQPEIAPTIGTPEEELLPSQTAPQGDLTRIQSQAYNTQLTSSLAGMFGGQGSVGYTPQGSPELSPTLRAGRSRGRRRVRMFGARRRRGGSGDQFSRAGDRIARLTNINI